MPMVWAAHSLRPYVVSASNTRDSSPKHNFNHYIFSLTRLSIRRTAMSATRAASASASSTPMQIPAICPPFKPFFPLWGCGLHGTHRHSTLLVRLSPV